MTGPAPRWWPGPGWRLLIGAGGLAATGLAVRRTRVGPVETRLFRVANDRPDCWYAPAWAVMQAGNLAAAPVAGLAAARAGRPVLAGRLLAAGGLSWSLAKVVKGVYRRPRPAQLLAGARPRGREPAGLGYVSGHAAVVVALTAAGLPQVAGRPRMALALVVSGVSVARVYVGAHLPLDVVGGACLGITSEALVALAADRLAGPATPHRGRAQRGTKVRSGRPGPLSRLAW